MQERLPPSFLSPLRIVIREGPSTVGASLTFANFFIPVLPTIRVGLGRNKRIVWQIFPPLVSPSPAHLLLRPKAKKRVHYYSPSCHIPYRRTLTRTMHSWKESGGEKGRTPARPCTINTMCTQSKAWDQRRMQKKIFFKKSNLQKFVLNSY